MAAKRSIPPPKKVVLVVEDDVAVRAMLVKALSTRYKVYEAADGLHASETLGKIPAPDLMVCDVMMPRIDGFSLARIVRADDALSRMQIIFLTAKTAPGAIVQGIQLGARHYIQKPFSVKDLLDKVDKLLK